MKDKTRAYAFKGIKLTEEGLKLKEGSTVSTESTVLCLKEDFDERLDKNRNTIDPTSKIGFVDKCPYCHKPVREDRKVEVFQGGGRFVAHFDCHINQDKNTAIERAT